MKKKTAAKETMPKAKSDVIQKTQEKQTGFARLKPIRIFDLRLIPMYLMKQVKPRDINFNTLLMANKVITENPATLLYVYVTTNHQIKGWLWATMNVLNREILVHILSVDKEYQNTNILPTVREQLLELKATFKAKSVTFVTTRPDAFLRGIPCKKSKKVLMEVE